MLYLNNIMSTEPFPTFSPSDIRKLLNSTIHAQKTLSTASNGTFTQNSNPHNGLLLITAFFTNLKLSNILSGYMGKSKDIREVVTGSFSAAKECETVFTLAPTTLMGYPTLKSGASVCWLCGFTINQMGEAINRLYPGTPTWSDNAPNANAPNAPECEHIVPAGAAMIYLDIPSRRRGTTEGNNDLYANYEWSHKFCNATASDGGEGEGSAGKSDKLFFNMLDVYGNLLSPTVNFDNIKRWLIRLAGIPLMSTLISAYYTITPEYDSPINAWANAQGLKMFNRVQQVCNYIVLKRNNYPTIFGQGVGSELDGDAVNPATPFLGDPRNTVGPGVMVGDLLNLARNVSFVFNDLVSKNPDRMLLEALIFSQSMMHLVYQDGGAMLAAINANRTDLITQKGFSNDNGNGILNGVMPLHFIKEILSQRSIERSDIDQQYGTSMDIWKSKLDENQANYVQQFHMSTLVGGGLSPSVFRGKRKKTRRNKLKQKRTRRNKKSKK